MRFFLFFFFLEQNKDFYKTIRFWWENISKYLTLINLYGQREIFFRLPEHKYISNSKYSWAALNLNIEFIMHKMCCCFENM